MLSHFPSRSENHSSLSTTNDSDTIAGAVAVTPLDNNVPTVSPLGLPHVSPAVAAALPLPPPVPSAIATPTPVHEYPPDLATLEFKQSLGLPQEPVKTPSIARNARNLRLPSFDALGISSPLNSTHVDFAAPSQLTADTERTFVGLDGSLQVPDDIQTPPSSHPASTPEPLPPNLRSSEQPPQAYRAVENYVLTQTPPDDSGNLDWSKIQAQMVAGHTDTSEPAVTEKEGGRAPIGVDSVSQYGLGSNVEGQSNFSLQAGRAPWLADALAVILDVVHHHNKSEAIKILSHALPSPSANGHAFPAVIDSIQQTTSSSSIMWMNVWHAVSGRFKFEDLPKSPPTTPAPPFEGDDYFTQRIFDYAVEVPDYSQRLTAQPLTPLLRSHQRPAIAPSSIDVSIVERYIPPTSIIEFEELFKVDGRSFLHDRLIELSPAHGTLLFIYPTRAGGETFKKAYLDPILDPTLRSMMISHGLPVNVVEDIGRMSAIAHLLAFTEMQDQLRRFLDTLNSNARTSHNSRFHRPNTHYHLQYSQPHKVRLDRRVWAQDWWSKQEKLRIQRAFESHDVQSATLARQTGQFAASAHLAIATRETQQAAGQADQVKLIQRAQTQSLLRDAERTRGERHPGDNEQLILRLLKEVAVKEYKDGVGPREGVEVGVFVVVKSLRGAGAEVG